MLRVTMLFHKANMNPRGKFGLAENGAKGVSAFRISVAGNRHEYRIIGFGVEQFGPQTLRRFGGRLNGHKIAQSIDGGIDSRSRLS